ncbi:MAG: hypothetical protein Fur003_1840 [Candidatus Dojkabacteria bacterium]
MSAPHITILILNWNKKTLLEQNFSSVQSLDYPNYKILIIDNGSTDGTVEYVTQISKNDSKVRLLALDKNYGYVGGNNAGIKKVIEEGKSQYVLILNNDVKVSANLLTELLKGFTDDSIGLATSNIQLYYPYQKVELKVDQATTLTNLQLGALKYYALQFEKGFETKGEFLEFPKPLEKEHTYYFAIPSEQLKEAFLQHTTSEEVNIELQINGEKREANSNVPLKLQYVTQNAGTNFIEGRMVFEDRHIFEFAKKYPQEVVDAACGAAMLVRVDLLKKFGAFREKYFMYWEDSELAFRFGREGFKTMFVPSAICYHIFWGSSGNKETGTQIYYGNRNRLWFIKRYFGFKDFGYHWIRSAVRTIIIGLKCFGGDQDKRMRLYKRIHALVSAFSKES